MGILYIYISIFKIPEWFHINVFPDDYLAIPKTLGHWIILTIIYPAMKVKHYYAVGMVGKSGKK